MAAGTIDGTGAVTQVAAMQRLLSAAFERGSRFIHKRLRGVVRESDIESLCAALLSSRGEVSGVVIAARILETFLQLSGEDKTKFFAVLAAMNPDARRVSAAAAEYANTGAAALAELTSAAEPPRQELFRRLNLAPGGTAALVEMRRQLIEQIPARPEFACIDADLEHLFSSWFNRGFLELKTIDWHTPANVLEKIIAYEAIHEIRGWDDLRARLLPEDRRCFGFFHPAMRDEPLIFVEVALTRFEPSAVGEVLAAGSGKDESSRTSSSRADTAVFYSISKCHAGLRGVSFGNFLIKQVAQKLTRELPGVKNFVTLSPVPGLINWLGKKAKQSKNAARALKIVGETGWEKDEEQTERARDLMLPLAAEYLLSAKREDGKPEDAVARFHLGNGATLMRVNWLADAAPVRLQQSAGVMVNYKYVLDKAEDNHEAYTHGGKVVAASAVRALLPKAEKTKGTNR